ncbi:MAG: hypothetical protein HEQ32_04945 [Vampirovibrio sp.]
MNKSQSASPQASASNGKGTAPTHIVYQVLDRESDKSAIWTRIGAAWPHNDGKGFNITLTALPVDGRLSVRVASEAKN